jgi:signal transduction histidine kinase/CheY-like chemotaxis protein
MRLDDEPARQEDVSNMTDRRVEARANDVLAGGGELGALMRDYDWSSTPLGPPEQWPRSLKTCVRIMLASRQPIWIGWGEELTFLYNDPYKAIIGGKHPWALGKPTSVVWKEIWDSIAPMLRTAMTGDEGTYVEAQLLIMERYGYEEETYYTFSYTPIPNDEGVPFGIICYNTDDTQRVISERQMALLRELAARTAEARTIEDACAFSADALATNPWDLPFALIYLLDPDDRGSAVLAGPTGIQPGHPAAPERISLGGASIWPVADMQAHEVRVVDLDASFGALPTGPWGRPPMRAAVLPIASSGELGRSGFLVTGLNPFRLFDEGYRGFAGLVAGQISASIGNAEAYQQERQRAEALAELDRAKTTFFSNVSHELRTPLTLMLGPTEDLLAGVAGDVSPQAKDQLTLLHRNELRLLKLVNTLLDFSRIEAGRVQASYEPVDLATYTAELASTFRSAIEHAGLEMVMEAPPLSEPVFVDREMWEKIVLNLLSNAFKHTFEGTIAVTLHPSADGRAVELAISDTGVGIPAEEIPHLFERFHRVQGAKSRTHEGTGIGLALVQELVRLQGGEIAVESREGVGTTFTVTLPFGTAHLPRESARGVRTRASTAVAAAAYTEEAMRWLPEPATEAPSESAPEALERTEPGAVDAGAEPRPRVLVADDNADMRDYVAKLLRQQHYRVEAVPNGAAALAAARREAPDLVLSDVMMPELDGFGLLRAMRADPAIREVPILLLSARAGEEARVEGIQAGADDYLPKPFSARELLARVGTHLELARVRRDALRAERKLSEQRERARHRLAELFRQVPAYIAILRGPDHVFEMVNPLTEHLLAGRHLVGRPVGEALPEAAAQGFTEILDQVYRRGEPYFANEQLVRLDRGRGVLEDVYLNFIYQPLLDEEGQVYGILDFAVDVTEQVLARQQIEQQAAELEELQLETEAMNEELQQTNEELLQANHVAEMARADAEAARAEAEAANRAKSEFLAAMSHELRTPLNAIAGYVQLIEMGIHGPVAEAQLQALDRVRRSQQHLLNLINDVLNFAKLEAGRIEYDMEEVSLAAVVAEVLPMVEPLLLARGLSSSVDVEDVRVWADPEKLRQILLNLLSNAVKFTEPGGRVSMDTPARENPLEDMVLLRVSDTGIGVPADKLEAIFDPFVQAHRNLTRSTQGTGLGLAISRDLARGMGGDLHVRSVEGQGAAFTVALRHAQSRPEASNAHHLQQDPEQAVQEPE